MAARVQFHFFGSRHRGRRTDAGRGYVIWLPRNGSPKESWTYGL